MLANKADGQIITQTYTDPCDNKTYTVTFPLPNNSIIVIVRNKSKSFTYAEAQNGAIQTWVNSIFSTPCPVTQTVTQTIQNTVSQTASQAASSAASSAASTAASAASSTASSTVSTSPGASASSSTSSQSQSSSSSGSSSSSSSSSDTKSESSSSGESKSESKSESKEESKSESKEEKKEDKKEDKKEEKKQLRMNPIMVNSDLTTVQNPNGGFTPILSLGMSQSSATGESNWGASAMIWMDFKSVAISINKSDLIFKEGQLKAIKSYSYTIAKVQGTNMTFGGYTWIKPHSKLGTIGYNLSYINIKLKEGNGYSYSLSSSATGFWTKPYPINNKVTLSPGIFIMSSPFSYNTTTGSSWNYNINGLIGCGYSYRISKRFGVNLDYKAMLSTVPGSSILSFFLIGSKMQL